MFALLFDRRSLWLTGFSLAAVGALLFSAGLVTGLTLLRERSVVPPHWIDYGPVEMSDLRGGQPGTPGAGSRGSATGGAGASGGAATPSGTVGSGDGEWAPFAPGDPHPDAPPDASGAPSDSAPPPPPLPGSAGGEGGVGSGTGSSAGSGAAAEPPANSAGGGSDAGSVSDPGSGSPDTSIDRATARAAEPTPAPARIALAGSRDDLERPASSAPSPEEAAAGPGCDGAAGDRWYVQAGAYSVAANAERREEAVQARFATQRVASGGVPPAHAYLRRTRTGSGTDLTVVRLGPFPDLRQAQRAARLLGDAFVGREAEGDCAGGR